MTTVLNGLLGGAVAGVLAALVARAVTDDTTLTDVLAATLGRDSPVAPRWGYLAEALVGAVAGGVLVALELLVFDLLAVPPGRGEALAVALGWSAVLFVATSAVWRVLSATSGGDSSLRAVFVSWLIYGLALGVWVRLTWIT